MRQLRGGGTIHVGTAALCLLSSATQTQTCCRKTPAYGLSSGHHYRKSRYWRNAFNLWLRITEAVKKGPGNVVGGWDGRLGPPQLWNRLLSPIVTFTSAARCAGAVPAALWPAPLPPRRAAACRSWVTRVIQWAQRHRYQQHWRRRCRWVSIAFTASSWQQPSSSSLKMLKQTDSKQHL